MQITHAHASQCAKEYILIMKKCRQHEIDFVKIIMF